MDERRARIHDDLRGLIAGDLLFAPLDRAPYAFDGSLYEIDPLAVVVPRSVEDLVVTVKYAAEHAIPIHARGAGTGLAGESLGAGFVVDFSRYLRRIIEVQPDRVIVQPGVILDELNTRLAAIGRRLGPDPSGSATCTIGGMIASDAAGARSLKYGTTADAVESLEVVFANGEPARLGCEPWPAAQEEPRDFRGAVARRIALHLNWHADLIARNAPRSPRNRAGYPLWALARPEGLDLARLMVGSEGTLALFTQATLRTVPIAAARAVVVLPFGRLSEAAEAVTEVLRHAPSACELYDWRRLNLARDSDPALRSWITEAAESVLIVEFEGHGPDEVARGCRGLISQMKRWRTLVADPTEFRRREDCDRLMDLRSAVNPLLMSARGPARPIPLIEDVAVPPAALPEFLQRLQTILKAKGVNWIFHAHAGDGQTHVRPFLAMSDPEDVKKLEDLATQVYEAALAVGGTISGEHGCGLVRSQFIPRQFGELAQVFREIKYAFDPQNLLNPGKIVGSDPHQMTHHLARALPVDDDRQPTAGLLPVLNSPVIWGARGRAEQISSCNGCGDCRTRAPELRMCPTFRALRTELATPRAKVNLLRQIATGVVGPRLWGSEELRAHADLCVHCNLCRTECPAQIDVSSLMIEVKAAYVENHGLFPNDWAFTHIERWGQWASRLPILTNAVMGNRPTRWVIERLFDLSRHRVIPRAHRWSFLRRAERLGLTRARPHEAGPRVAYFVDVFANYFDQELAESVVALLQHCGVNVYVPRGQRGCGMPSLVAGDLERTRSLLLTNLRILGDAVRDGYTVVCSEPTATLMLKHEALKLTDDLDAALVAANTMDVGQYLVGLASRGGLPDPGEPLHVKVGYHQPCHLRALDVGTPGLDLIRKIPGLEAEFIDRGCSGIAGVFGLHRKNFRTSLRAGRGLRTRLKEPDIEIGSTECGTCRMQMEQGLTKRALHPVKLLCLGYGLNPALRRHMKQKKHRHEID